MSTHVFFSLRPTVRPPAPYQKKKENKITISYISTLIIDALYKYNYEAEDDSCHSVDGLAGSATSEMGNFLSIIDYYICLILIIV